MARRRKRKSKIQRFRQTVLGFFVLLVTVLAVGHQLALPGFGPIDALCPFGGIETIYMFFANGGFLQRIFSSNLVLLVGVILIGILVGRYFCGWICMFGGLQEYFRMLGKKIFGKRRRFTIPEKIDRPLRYTKYAVLVVILYFTWKTGELVIRPYDPFVAYAHLPAGLKSVWDEFAIGLIILVVFMVASMFYDRVFCKYLCPLGAFLGILTKVGVYRIRREESTCTDCKICDRSCPVNLNVSTPKAIKSPECINCLECVTDCPTKKSTLFPSFFRKAARPLTIAILGIVIYVGTIGAAKITGNWQSAYETLEQRAEEGALSPDDIRGSNTLQEVADNFGVNLDELYERLNLNRDQVPAITHLREIKDLIDAESFEADEVRVVVREMLGLPPAETEQSGTGNGEGEFEGEIEGAQEIHESSAETTDQGNAGAVSSPDYANFNLEGTMTIQDAAQALGVAELEIIRKLGLPETFPQDRPLRDLREEFGYTMPGLKEKIKE